MLAPSKQSLSSLHCIHRLILSWAMLGRSGRRPRSKETCPAHIQSCKSSRWRCCYQFKSQVPPRFLPPKQWSTLLCTHCRSDWRSLWLSSSWRIHGTSRWSNLQAWGNWRQPAGADFLADASVATGIDQGKRSLVVWFLCWAWSSQIRRTASQLKSVASFPWYCSK